MADPIPMLTERDGRFFARWSADDALMRSRNRSVLEAPDRIGSVDDAFLAALRSDDAEVKWESLRDLRDLKLRLDSWGLCARPSDASARAAILFRLTPPSAETGSRAMRRGNAAQDGMWRLEVASPVDGADMCRALGEACRVYAPLCGMADRSMELEQSEAEAFLRLGAPALKAAGYGVDVRGGLVADVSAETEMLSAQREPALSERSVKAKITIRVAGERVSRADIAFLLDQESSVVFFRGRWIEVDRAILKNALKVLDADGKRMTGREAVSFAFRVRRSRGLSSTRVKGTGWFGRVLGELSAGGAFRTLREPKGFKGKLRAYQKRGYSWLKYLSDRGFGALLADDMGLGKTVQTIAWLLKRRETPGCGRALVVSPVSVTMNWMREFERFAPGLKVLLHQGSGRLSGGSFLRAAGGCDVVVTGYHLFVKDFHILADVGFDALVLDEAQMIKNPDTRVAGAARTFPCADRVALTGTPFENRVTDLWSIEEFLNAGLLGPRGEFVEDFERPMQNGGAAPSLAELRKMLSPFLLRRLKNDPGIAAELGEKREIREYCVLSPRQRAAYEVALARYSGAPHDAGGGKGRVLALLTELKLVCDGLDANGELLGGKVDRLVELLESIFDAGESALVFTQYVKVGRLIRRLVERKFGVEVPFLHGGLKPSAREAQISSFNAAARPTAFVLSLKAGGFGLNLTKATHVIHFDRWWNPAIENQATDRAHRIGQGRTVFVHLFVTHGTLEDRIDRLLEEKRAIAGQLVVSGESFLLKMGEREFARTVGLSQ